MAPLSLIFSFCLLCTATALAAPQNLPDLPVRSTVQNQLERISKADSPTAADQAKRDDLEKTLALLDSIDKEQEKAKAQQKTLDAAPGKLQQYNSEL